MLLFLELFYWELQCRQSNLLRFDQRFDYFRWTHEHENFFQSIRADWRSLLCLLPTTLFKTMGFHPTLELVVFELNSFPRQSEYFLSTPGSPTKLNRKCLSSTDSLAEMFHHYKHMDTTSRDIPSQYTYIVITNRFLFVGT